MTRTIYKPWLPIDGMPSVLYCEGLHHDYEYFRVLLRAKDAIAPTLRILFESIIAYRNINESYRHRTFSSFEGAPPPLATVINSPWVQWLKEESVGILDNVALTHYAIFTPEDCIDVVSEFPPDVQWLND